MDALVAYGSGSDESDNPKQQKQANHEGGDIREMPGFLPININR
jgi:hypothetical protein